MKRKTVLIPQLTGHFFFGIGTVLMSRDKFMRKNRISGEKTKKKKKRCNTESMLHFQIIGKQITITCKIIINKTRKKFELHTTMFLV